MSLLFTALSPLGLIALFIAARQLFIKHRETSRDGWKIVIDNREGPPDGNWYREVLLRPAGPAVLYEVRVARWYSRTGRAFWEKPIPRLTCDSDPILATVQLPLSVEDAAATWVGVIWTDPMSFSTKERAIRINVLNGELQRWAWHKRRNWFWFWHTPYGGWKTVPDKWNRNRFSVPKRKHASRRLND